MISVVIPLYNKVQYVKRAIDSVLAQTYRAFELIVIDDGSTDGSADVVRRICDPRIRMITQKNAGASGARNSGIREASCELVAFLDADDEWMPCFLDTVMGLRSRHPDAGLYATAYRFSSAAENWRPAFSGCPDSPQGGLIHDYFQAGLGPLPVCSTAVMAPKRILEEAGVFPEGLHRGEDMQVWARIALGYRVAWSPVEGAVYHLSAHNRACNAVPLGPDVGVAAVIEEFLQSGREAISPRRHVQEFLVLMRLTHAMACHVRGKRTWALGLLEKTRDTQLFKKRRQRLRYILCLPAGLVRIALRIQALAHMITQKSKTGR